MREIKFRAWDKRHKKMYRVNSVHFDDPLYGVWCWVDYYDVINQGSYPRQIKSKSLILMQYTGLKDRHGQDIYEGDIVQTSEGNYAVEWRGAPWGYRHVMWHNKYEVVGNIYENPDLLERKDHA